MRVLLSAPAVSVPDVCDNQAGRWLSIVGASIPAPVHRFVRRCVRECQPCRAICTPLRRPAPVECPQACPADESVSPGEWSRRFVHQIPRASRIMRERAPRIVNHASSWYVGSVLPRRGHSHRPREYSVPSTVGSWQPFPDRQATPHRDSDSPSSPSAASSSKNTSSAAITNASSGISGGASSKTRRSNAAASSRRSFGGKASNASSI